MFDEQSFLEFLSLDGILPKQKPVIVDQSDDGKDREEQTPPKVLEVSGKEPGNASAQKANRCKDNPNPIINPSLSCLETGKLLNAGIDLGAHGIFCINQLVALKGTS